MSGTKKASFVRCDYISALETDNETNLFVNIRTGAMTSVDLMKSYYAAKEPIA